VTVVDRTNHHVFQPLLYQVATATLAATDITAPIRWLLRGQRNARVLLNEVQAIDVDARSLSFTDGTTLEYDYLIVATGSRHSYFGRDEWEELAPGLKSIDDALEIRRRFLLAFEMAEQAETKEEQEAWLTFVLVGGGPTGVELAGMVPTVARFGLPDEFRRVDTRTARVILLEGGPRVLPAFPEDLSAKAVQQLVDLGVDVRVGAMVTGIGDGYVKVGDERIPTRSVFWAAGNAPSPLGRDLRAPLDRSGRVIVEPDLSVPGHPEVFVVGDLAAMTTDGKPVPGVAPAAMQSGPRAARNILRRIAGRETVPFRYRNKGDVATIGRFRAIALIAGLHLSGAVAWWAWLLIHILYLAGFRNRLSVLFEWAYSFFTFQRGARLITEKRG
ncbi:MAG TPA: NAD(P)/FAD-dependent oxidoreductase, partial [Gemmatimonadaceae bacterium]|nr:NAD(P)/FAD-dependent oxidoreductase [Gemmatimonadaceae bacterium]